MKYILLIAAIVFTLQSSAQNITLQDSLNKTSRHELALQYISKGKQQQKTGTILVIIGTTLLLAGIIVAVSDLHNGFNTYNNRGGDAGSILSGGIVLAAGIPFTFIGKQVNCCYKATVHYPPHHLCREKYILLELELIFKNEFCK